jgi:hypothetical protein
VSHQRHSREAAPGELLTQDGEHQPGGRSRRYGGLDQHEGRGVEVPAEGPDRRAERLDVHRHPIRDPEVSLPDVELDVHYHHVGERIGALVRNRREVAPLADAAFYVRLNRRILGDDRRTAVEQHRHLPVGARRG